MRQRLSGLIAAVVVLLVLLPAAGANRNVKKLISDLTASGDKKVRLSAANSLAKIGADDEDAIEAFIGVLVGSKDYKKDSDKSVRATAAAGLGKVVTADTDEELRDQAIAALQKAASKDKEKFVKKQAQKALDKLEGLDGGGGGGGGGGDGIYIDIGKMASETGDVERIKSRMKKSMEKTIASRASTMKTGTGLKKPPKGFASFHVDGTLNEVKISKGKLTCKVSMLLATFDYPKKPSIFATLDGKGAVGTDATDPSDDPEGVNICVDAVVEDIVIKKIIPTIKSKAAE